MFSTTGCPSLLIAGLGRPQTANEVTTTAPTALATTMATNVVHRARRANFRPGTKGSPTSHGCSARRWQPGRIDGMRINAEEYCRAKDVSRQALLGSKNEKASPEGPRLAVFRHRKDPPVSVQSSAQLVVRFPEVD